MDQTKALIKLLESADLIRMIEDLTNPSLSSQLSASALGGIRVTLRNVREAILISHDALVADFNKPVAQSQSPGERPQERQPARRPMHQEISREEVPLEPESVEFVTKTTNGYGGHQASAVRRGDLRSSLSKMSDHG